MNANLSLTIKNWLTQATKQLSNSKIKTARLDSELILANVLQQKRTFLHAHGDNQLDTNSQKIADKLLARREKHEPLAYIFGYKEFYGRDFIVNPDVLIPRPESENIINQLKTVVNNTAKTTVYDVGTGSGCLGITAKLELPALDVTLFDISEKALKIAKQNAKELKADVKIIKNDLLTGRKKTPEIIIANLPYVDKEWRSSPEIQFEPAKALFAPGDGTKFIKQLIAQADKLKTNFLIIEADPRQHNTIKTFAAEHRFMDARTTDFVITFMRNH